MISPQLEQISEDAASIQLKHKPIATLFLWVTRLETADESWSLRDIRRQLLDLWDRIHPADPALAAIYLDVLLHCTDVNGDRVSACPGLERVVGVASTCLLRILSSGDPGSSVVTVTRKRYIEVIPRKANFEFEGPLCHTMIAIHALLIRSRERQSFEEMGYKPCPQEHALFVTTLVQVAFNRRKHGKVPRWVLRFSRQSILSDPEPPVSVIADCLMIIAVDLGCNVSESDIRNLDKRYACLTQLHSLPS